MTTTLNQAGFNVNIEYLRCDPFFCSFFAFSEDVTPFSVILKDHFLSLSQGFGFILARQAPCSGAERRRKVLDEVSTAILGGAAAENDANNRCKWITAEFASELICLVMCYLQHID